MARPKRSRAKRQLSDAEVGDRLIKLMADVGAHPAFIYAFKKTGVYICEENEALLSMEDLLAFERAVDEYYRAVEGPVQ
jgi:hypothetical protein